MPVSPRHIAARYLEASDEETFKRAATRAHTALLEADRILRDGADPERIARALAQFSNAMAGLEAFGAHE